MTKKTKKLLRFILPLLTLSVFALASIIVIVISQGKKLADNGTIVETSIVRVNAIPSDVQVFINEKQVTVNDNKVNVDPGQVEVTLKKDGYSTWQKTFFIEEGVVKDIFAQLYPSSIKSVKLSDTDIDKMFFSREGDFAFYTVINSKDVTQNGIWKLKLSRNILDFSVNTPVLISKFTTDITNILKTNNYELKISNDNAKLILWVKNLNQFELYSTGGLNDPVDLVKTIGFTPINIDWFKGSDSLIITKNEVLLEMDLASKQVNLINLFEGANIIQYSISANNLYYVYKSKIYKYSNKVNSELIIPVRFENILIDPISVYTSKDNIDTFIVRTKTNLLFLDFDKLFYDTIETNADVVAISPNGTSIIFKKNNLLGTYTAEETLSGNSYNTTVNYIDTNSDLIKKIDYSLNSKNIILIDKDNILTVMNLDGLNRQEFLKDFKISGDDVLISNSGTEMYSLIKETDDSSLLTTNLFKFNLEIQ